MTLSSLNLRMANFRRMLDKMVPKTTTAISCEVSAKDMKRFYDFIRDNCLPIAIRGGVGGYEVIVIEENKDNDMRKYTNENTSGYYVLAVGDHYGKLSSWIYETFGYFYTWKIGEKMTFGYQLETEKQRLTHGRDA